MWQAKQPLQSQVRYIIMHIWFFCSDVVHGLDEKTGMMRMFKMMVIAPYEGLSKLVLAEKDRYSDFLIDVETGDLQEGVEIARRAEKEGYDVILSRGGTAEIIEANVNIPVVSIQVSGYDLLRVVRLSQNYTGALALVGFPHITQSAKIACRLLQTQMDIYTINSEREAEKLLFSLSAKKYEAFIGDVTIVRAANKLALNSILITVGKESLNDAMEEARRMLVPLHSIQKRVDLFEAVLENAKEGVFLFDGQDKPIYANHIARNSGLEEKVKKYIPVAREKQIQAVEIQGQDIYSIRSSRFNEDENICFFLKKEKEFKKHIRGIRFQNGESSTVPFGYLNTKSEKMRKVIENARHFGMLESPVLIVGERGTGRHQMAHSIHRASKLCDFPFIQIDCQLLEEELAGETLEHVRADLPGTWYFQNIQAMGQTLQDLLIDLISSDFFTGSRRLLCSCNPSIQEKVQQDLFSETLFSAISHCSLYIPTLGERKEDIGDLVSLALSNANAKQGKQIVGVDKDALAILRSHTWPGNIEQLIQVVDMLVLNASGDMITSKEVENVMYHFAYTQLNKKEGEEPGINISREKTLDDIVGDVINYVLLQENGNQSAAAKRLGISRSTLWRRIR